MNIKPDIAWFSIAVSCVAFFYAGFGLEIATLAFMAMVVLWHSWVYPEKSFLILIALSPLLPLLKATQTLGAATLIKDVIIFALFFRNFLVPLLMQKLPYRRNALFAPIAALVIWACFEVIRSGITTLSILRLRDIVLYILLYFGVLYLPHTARRMKARLIVFVTTLVIVLAMGVVQFIYLPDSTVLRFDPVREIWIPRVASTFAHPTVFAEFLITGAVLLMGLLISALHFRLPIKPLQTVGVISLLCAIVALLYFTYTRAGWLGFAIGIVAIMVAYFLTSHPLQLPLGKGERTHLLSLRRRGWVTLFALIFVCLFSFGIFRFTPVGTFVQSAFDPNYASNAERIVFLVNLISQTSNTDAVIGKGLGNTITQARKGGDATAFDIASGQSRTIQLTKDQTLVDNQYLKTFIEMGTVGIVILFWLFWRLFIASKEALHGRTQSSFVLGIACIGFLAAFIVQAVFVDIWDIYPTNAIFWTLAALVSQARK